MTIWQPRYESCQHWCIQGLVEHREEHQEKPNGMNSRNSPRWCPGISTSSPCLKITEKSHFTTLRAIWNSIRLQSRTIECWILDSFVKCMWNESIDLYIIAMWLETLSKDGSYDLMYLIYLVFQIFPSND